MLYVRMLTAALSRLWCCSDFGQFIWICRLIRNLCRAFLFCLLFHVHVHFPQWKSICWILQPLTWLSVFVQESLITFGWKIHQQTKPDSWEDMMCPSPRSFKQKAIHPSGNTMMTYIPIRHLSFSFCLIIHLFHPFTAVCVISGLPIFKFYFKRQQNMFVCQLPLLKFQAVFSRRRYDHRVSLFSW